jgi:hypothetical protein
MWRIDGGAHLNTHGRYPGVIESVREPLHDPLDGQCGQEVVAVRFGSATLHLRAPADSGHSEGDACRIDLDPAVTRVWAAR